MRLSRHDERLRVEVRDDGPGFEATAGSRTADVGGLGLQLVERMAGAWAAEREGTTTLVWFEVASDAAVASIH